MSKIISTGYFGMHGAHPLAVAITSSRPPWFRGPHCQALAPGWALVAAYKRGHLTRDEYGIRYFAQLDGAARSGVTADKIVASLPSGAVLLCYEKPPAFCHRELAARWLTRHCSLGVLAMPVVELVA